MSKASGSGVGHREGRKTMRGGHDRGDKILRCGRNAFMSPGQTGRRENQWALVMRLRLSWGKKLVEALQGRFGAFPGPLQLQAADLSF